ncbi:MAG: ABC transporter permease, partial [Gemmatimonadota bacterium]|nr:ABC transporter permease [Gemmatimonadota bacterium]
TESLVIAVLGAALGYVLARVSVTAISRALFAAFPPEAGTVVLNLQPSWRVLSITAVMAVASVLVFGLVPALQGTSLDVAGQLKGDDRAFGGRLRRSRFRDWLVTAQVAACLVLTVAAGILTQSVRHMLNTQTGVDPSHVVVARLGLSTDGRIPPKLATARAEFAAKVALLPGVASLARVFEVPFDGRLRAMQIQEGGAIRVLRMDVVTPAYFDVVRQRLLRGRIFSAADTSAASAVAVVTSATAKMLWPGRDAIGQQLHAVAEQQDAPERIYDVIGVVADARTGWLWDDDDGAYAYLPASPGRMTASEMPLLIRTDGSAGDVTAALTRVALDVDPTAPLRVTPLTDYLGVQLLPFEYASKVALGIGAIGLLLSMVGLYGIVAFAVRQRTHEVAVHIAMGAGRRDVLRLVLRRELRLVVIGLVIGLVLASGEAKLIGSMQVPLTPLGPAGFVLLPLLLLLVAVTASVVPAMRALRVDPMRVLRQE